MEEQESLGERAERLDETAGEYSQETREAAQELADRTRERAERGREQAAGGMERAAEMTRERAARMGGKQGEAAAKVADRMEGAAGYLRSHSSGEMWNDLEGYAKGHPTEALAGAVVVGFLLGRVLR